MTGDSTENKGRKLLMIMAKVPEAGKVKTRLAETIGDELALQIYLKLLSHTHDIASKANADKLIFYAGLGDTFDLLDYYRIPKTSQVSGGLGERMQNAFERAFAQGYEHVAIIGSDCYELSTSILDEAFKQLEQNDYVIGPAKDGGYYLLGMNRLTPQLFEAKTWSEENVCLDTLLDIKAIDASYSLLDTLSDIDREEDLPEELKPIVQGRS